MSFILLVGAILNLGLFAVEILNVRKRENLTWEGFSVVTSTLVYILPTFGFPKPLAVAFMVVVTYIHFYEIFLGRVK